MPLVKVYGIEIETNCADLLEIVMEFAASSYSHKCLQADKALEKLGERGCYKALKYIVKQFSGSSYSHKCSLANRALELM